MNDAAPMEATTGQGTKTVRAMTKVKEGVGAMLSSFSLSYGILLVFSVSYNLGYFKHIHPQIIELMTLSDYIDDTLHNIWFFLFFIVVLLSGLLGMSNIQHHSRKKFRIIVTLGLLMLATIAYALLSGFLHTQLLRSLTGLLSVPHTVVVLLCIVTLVLIVVAVVTYKISYAFVERHIADYVGDFILGITLLLFIILPYGFGVVRGYSDRYTLLPKDYSDQTVHLTLVDRSQMNDLYMVKICGKGIVLRQFTGEANSSDSRFFFIHWNAVRQIEYKKVGNVPEHKMLLGSLCYTDARDGS